MGIFSWMFSKNTEKNSHVRKWVVQEMERVDTANPDVYVLFVELINAAVQCGKDSNETQDDQLLQVSRQYLGDATIFEIACYTYYRLEDWLAKNQPELTTEITLPISKLIVEKFYTTFYVEEQQVSQLLQERLERYKAMASADDVEELHRALEQYIVMTKGDKFDKKDLQINQSSIILDLQYIKLSLTHYEEKYIAAFIAGMQDYCRKNGKKQLIEKPSQEQQTYLFGMALVAQKDWVRACTAFTKVLATNPRHYDALVQRGLVHLILRQSADALRDFTAAIEVNPSTPAAYLHRGQCHHRNLRLKEQSLADYCEAIALAPMAAAGYFGRGELYDEIALYDERQALEQNDHATYAHISEEFLAAIEDYSQVIALEPKHDGAYANRGLAYARKARVNKNTDFMVKAIADFATAISLNWENGYLYKQQEEMEELLEQISPSARQADTAIAASHE